MKPETLNPAPTPLEPAKEIATEMSFGAALHRAVKDLFTHQAIAEKVQAIPANDVLPALLASWEQGLATRLQAEAQWTVSNVAAILDLLQSGEPLDPAEPLEWQQSERQIAPFLIATVCRENLRGILSPEEINGLSNQEMSQIAAQMGEAFQGSDFYWQSLEVAAKTVVAEKQAAVDQFSAPLSPPPSPETPIA